ncbi:hypothetical protein [Pseudomonas gorinensis]
MSDLICKKDFNPCRTPGMCAPHGGCNVEILRSSTKEALANLTVKDWEIIGLKATIAQQAQMIEHLRGGPTPLFTGVDMADSSADGRRRLAEYLIKQIAIEHPDQDTLLTVKYIAQWIALETGL